MSGSDGDDPTYLSLEEDEHPARCQHNISQVKLGKISYIYKCKKEELIQVLKEENLSFNETDTLEQIRKRLSVYYKEKQENLQKPVLTNKTKMSSLGELQQFDGDKWEAFEQQFECFVAVNDITDDKKVPLLITKLTSKVFETLTHLCSPTQPRKLTFEELTKKLKEKYVKPLPTALERVEFRKRNQLPSESIQDYALELRKLAGKCNFKDMEDQIKEKFMEGVSSKIIKFELMKSQLEMSLEKCIQVARTVEAALLHTSGSNEVTEIYFTQGRPKSAFKARKNTNKVNSNNKSQDTQCFCCGKRNHIKADCTLKRKFCSECGTQGHIYRMCPRKTRQTNILEAETMAKEETEDAVSSVKDLYETYTYNSVSRIPPYYLTINVNNQALSFQMDTGSDVSVMSFEDKIKYLNNFEMQECKILFRNFDQTVTKPLGIVTNVTVEYKDTTQKLNVFIVQNNSPRVIGRDWLHALKLWPPKWEPSVNIGTNVIQNVSDAERLVTDQFAEVFSPGWGNFKGEVINLKLKPNAVPKCLPARRVPYALREKVNNEITRLLNEGRITEIEQSEWGTPVVPILKPDGSVRLCGDYKLTVNPFMEIDHFPLPHVDDILHSLSRGEYYCELDLKEAYLQAPLSEESKLLTTIVTETGTYMFNYLPYGVSSGPGAFQRLISKKLAKIQNVVVFIDNIYIKGLSLQQTYETLCQVLQKLQECEFKLKPSKCKFFTTSLDVFGFHVNRDGISLIQSNIEPLLKAKSPTSLTLLKSFLGKINYYSRFLQDMATTLKPLYDCTKKNKFCWTADCEEAFTKIKCKLASASNLRHYDPNLPLILSCDASDTGLAAVLSNRDSNGIVKPVAYASKKLSDAEQRYPTIDKEAMAVIFGITKFYNYLYGRTFELETDNAALVRIFGPNKSIPKMAAKRLQHYAIFLSAFNYKIRYIKTSLNPADFLSRIAIDGKDNSEVNIKLPGVEQDCSVLNYTNNSEMESLNWKKIQAESKKDIVFSKIIRYMSDGWPDKKELTEASLPFYNRRNELTIDRDCIFWGYRIAIPKNIRESVLTELHKSHFGIVRMKEIARSYFWWPKIDLDIGDLTKRCIICLQNSKTPTKIQKPWPVPSSTWYRLHADFLGPYHSKMFLVVVDSFSKWPEIYEMTSITSARTIEVFDSIFTRYGYPIHLVTDNGRSFTAKEFQDYCKVNNIKHTFSPPYHPATNGAAERFVETFKSAITKITQSGLNLRAAVNLFMFDYRSTPQRTTGVSPARLMLNREIRNRFSLLRPPPLAETVRERVDKREQGNREIQFEVGQKVMVRDYRRDSRPWVQGLVIEESIPGTTYIVDVEGLKWKRHINQMLSCSETLEELC